MATSVFETKAPVLMSRFMVDLLVTANSAAAMLGNVGHESEGLTDLTEDKPTVAGSRGGYGWPQWTGKRRRAFEAWCRRNNLLPASDEANYGFMIYELRGVYRSAVLAVEKASTLRDKVVAFEREYENAGIKHYDSRLTYARRALKAYNAKFGKVERTVKADKTPSLVMPSVIPAEHISLAQGRLRDLGYPEVGKVDGKWGDRSSGALSTFQADNGLPMTGQLDDATLTELMDVRTPHRAVASERAQATANDLKSDKTVQLGSTVKKIGAGVLATSGLGIGKEGVDLSALNDKVSGFKSLTDTLLSISPWIIGALVGGAVIYFGIKIVEQQVENYRKGRAL